jgi:hypothetical protein
MASDRPVDSISVHDRAISICSCNSMPLPMTITSYDDSDGGELLAVVVVMDLSGKTLCGCGDVFTLLFRANKNPRLMADRKRRLLGASSSIIIVFFLARTYLVQQNLKMVVLLNVYQFNLVGTIVEGMIYLFVCVMVSCLASSALWVMEKHR